ncbi:alpha/beta hydrolase family protein [Streptomyces sp. NBC_00885]|uniref:alpha/beta hydrolase n=1 Tax=Streptomyces sp. NBC_00885 TaxID=2975857 RepID=UPI00386B53FC|nr:alpha/beta hydrolase family protein [Streptomyces sp. NBC_00885]
MITWQQLEKLDLKEYQDAADGWGKVSSRANAAKDRVDNEMLSKLRETQKGKTADAATGDLTRLSRNYQYIHTECGLIRTALNGLASELAAPQRKLMNALADVPKTFTVQPNGSVEYPVAPALITTPESGSGTAAPGAPIPLIPGKAEGGGDANKALAEQIAEDIATALREADEIDGRYAGALRKLKIPDGVKGLDITDAMFADAANDTRDLQKAAGKYAAESEIPKGKSPADKAKWWNELPQEKRDEYATLYPASIGALDGIPATVRDDANRMVLAETRAQTQLDLNAIGPEPEKYIKHPSHGRTYRNPAWTEWSEKRAPYLAKLTGMDAIQDRFDRTGRSDKPGERPLPEAYLLGFDTKGIGHAIVANGNPDTATHTSVYVPGTTSNLEGIGGDVKRMETLWRASDALAEGESVSTITWLGYDAPQSLVTDAPKSEYADDGGPKLNTFLGGLRSSHEGGQDHLTVTGHSYGSTVIGAAARQGTLPVDDIFVAGSPGMQVGTAAELDVPRGHVFAAEADSDPYLKGVHIPYVGDDKYGGINIPFVTSDPVPDLGGWKHAPVDLDIDILPAFIDGDGASIVKPQTPTNPDFGAEIVATDGSRGHSGYWDEGTESLNNQARVTVGKYDRVTHAD